jgi:hypothetical protein
MTIAQHELQGDLRAGDAEGLRVTLLGALEAGDLRIETAGLGSADMAVVQVLLSARRMAAQAGRTLEIAVPENGPLARLLARLALDGALAA